MLNSCAPISAQQSGSQDICGRRSMHIKCKEQVHSALAWGTERTRSFFFDCTPFRETRSYIPRPVCEGKPFCAIEIKVEPLSHLIFHKTLLHMIPTAKLISQANIRGNRLNPYGVISGNIVLSQRHICYYAGSCKSRRQSVHFGGIRKRQANTVSSCGIMPRVSSKSAIISR